MDPRTELVDLTDDELRRRGGLKWTYPPDDVLPAWVAEIDVAPDPVVVGAVVEALAGGLTGYPPTDATSGVPDALAAYAERQWGWGLEPSRVVLTQDVMHGVHLALTTLCEDAPVVVPTPTYPPFLDVVPMAGRELVPVPLDPDAEVAALDLDRVDAALSAGARTVLLCNPHNPWGRAFPAAELTALLEVVRRHGARVVSDEIHAGLVHPGFEHVPFATLPGADEVTTTVLSASKAWNLPALKCAQLVTGSAADTAALRGVPMVANHGTSSLGIVAAVAAYTGGQPWLDAWVERLAETRDAFAAAVAEQLPLARLRPMEATYLAWLDVRAYGHDDPAAAALREGRVMVNDGRTFGPGGEGHVRVNLATSVERVGRLVDRLAEGLRPA
ncbi:aminotransferase class I/II-fold pyridoxal phosphate-dependent enzyme [Angustibacter peucedani]